MHVVFVHGSLDLGGIETLIARYAKHLRAHGHRVSVVLHSPGNPGLFADVSQVAQIAVVGQWRYYLPWLGTRIRTDQLNKILESNVGVVVCTGVNSLVFGQALVARLRGARLVTGVFSAYEFCWSPSTAVPRNTLAQAMFAGLLPTNVFFMNEATRAEHAERLASGCLAAPVIPLAIETRRFEEISRKPTSGLIVSVGRLTPFKTYNLWMLDIVAKLHAAGMGVRYHIYGDGPLLPELSAAIEARGLTGVVEMRGSVSYEDLPAVLGPAHVFVGMGTTVMEASATGVPAVVAVESSSEPLTHGFFHDYLDDNVGEHSAKHNPTDPMPFLTRAIQASPSEYADLSGQARRKASQYSMEEVLPIFVKFLEESQRPAAVLSRSLFWRDFAGIVVTFFRRLIGVEREWRGRRIRPS